jgi:NAD(P)H dehydrogenase (quinone)
MTDTPTFRPSALIVYAHPEPTSFTGAMKDAAVRALEAANVTVEVSDLYGEGFNPVAGRHDFTTVADDSRFHYQTEQQHAWLNDGYATDLQREQARVARADMLIFVFPLWWGGIPAILKGWAERVFSYGFAYADGFRFDKGYFQGRRAALGLATGGPKARFSTGDVYGEISLTLYPVVRAIEYMGLDVAEPFVAYAAPRVSDDERAAYLADWADRLSTLASDPAWRGARARARINEPDLPRSIPVAGNAWAQNR